MPHPAGPLLVGSLLQEDGDLILLESGGELLLGNAYLGFNVLDFWPNWEIKPIEAIERSGTILENRTGLPVVKPRADQPRQSMSFTFRTDSRAELARFRRFVASLRGRQRAFWIPTWEADLNPTAFLTGSNITVESIGYEGRMHDFHPRRHCVLVKWNRELEIFAIIGATDNGTTELLNTDHTFPGAPGYNNEHVMISFLLLVRLESDTIEYTYITPELMDAKLRVIELPLETPQIFS